MFRPRTSQASHEEFRDADADVSISATEAQAVYGDVLRLIPLTGGPRAQDLGWIKLDWSQQDELSSLPGDIAARWDVSFNNQFISSPQLFEFEPVSKFLDIDTQGGEYQFLRQHIGASTTQKHWVNNASNSVGWVVQFRVQSVVDQTGYGLLDGHYILLDDGVHRERCFIHHTGLFFENNPALNINCDMTSPREIRIGAKQDDMYVLVDNGLGVAAFDGFTGNTISKELGFGTTGAIAHYRTIWDYVNQHSNGIWIDERENVLSVYSVTGSTATTSSYHPKKSVESFEAAYVSSLGDLSGGVTQVTPQYRNSNVTTWTSAGTTTISAIGSNRIDLSSIPTVGDGSDEIRFLVYQRSNNGSAEPPRVDMITVVTTFGDPGVRLVPRYGHKRGGSVHVVDLLPNVNVINQQPTLTTGLSFLARFDGDYADEIDGVVGTPSNASFVDGRYGQAVKLGGLTVSSSIWDTFAVGFVDAVPYGKISNGANPIYTSGTGTLHLTAGNLSTLENGAIVDRQGQTAFASLAGDGFEVRDLPAIGAFGFILRIAQGSVKVKHGASEHTFTSYDYWTPKVVIVKSDSGVADLEFTAAEANSSWTVAYPKSYTYATGQVTFTPVTHVQGDGFAADAFVTCKALAAGPIISRLAGSSGFEIGLAAGGYPYAKAGDGTRLDVVTGAYPIAVDDVRNIALNYRRFGDHTGLQILVDGDVAGEKVTTVDEVSSGSATVTIGGSQPIYIEQVRIHEDQIDAHQFSAVNGFSGPSFESAYSIPRDQSNTLLLRMAYEAGAHTDDSGRGHHAMSLANGRLGLSRNYPFENKTAYLFWHNGALGVLHSPDFIQNFPQALFSRGVFYTVDGQVQEVYSKWNVGETIGWKVEILTTGFVKVTVKDGVSTHELTSDVVLGDRNPRSLYVAITSTGIEIKIDNVTKSVSASIGLIAAATNNARIGYKLAAYISDFVLRNALLSAADYSAWIDPSIQKWTPSADQIFIDGVAIPNENILHLTATRKYFTAPAGGPGNVPFYVLADSYELGTERPFKYVHGYERDIPAERVEPFAAKTHSPFRIVNEVPPGGVNIGYVQGPDISVDRNVSYIDLSHSKGQNISTYFGGEFVLRDLQTGLLKSEYRGQLDTNDIAVSNRSVIRRDVTTPTPLFYRYLIGRGRRYVYQPTATTVADVALIRNQISLLNGRGQPISFERFPWDIEVSSLDVNGNPLPPNIFAVTLFSQLPFLADESVQVRYAAADGLHDWQIETNFVEFVNTSPALAEVVSDPGYDQYVLSFTPTGTYDIQIGRTGL